MLSWHPLLQAVVRDRVKHKQCCRTSDHTRKNTRKMDLELCSVPGLRSCCRATSRAGKLLLPSYVTQVVKGRHGQLRRDQNPNKTKDQHANQAVHNETSRHCVAIGSNLSSPLLNGLVSCQCHLAQRKIRVQSENVARPTLFFVFCLPHLRQLPQLHLRHLLHVCHAATCAIAPLRHLHHLRHLPNLRHLHLHYLRHLGHLSAAFCSAVNRPRHRCHLRQARCPRCLCPLHSLVSSVPSPIFSVRAVCVQRCGAGGAGCAGGAGAAAGQRAEVARLLVICTNRGYFRSWGGHLTDMAYTWLLALFFLNSRQWSTTNLAHVHACVYLSPPLLLTRPTFVLARIFGKSANARGVGCPVSPVSRSLVLVGVPATVFFVWLYTLE